MKSIILCLFFLLLPVSAGIASAQAGQTAEKPAAWSSGKVNTALVEARTATAEQRFQDAESIMLQVTEANPKLIPPWIELGKAQLGLKKYPEAENSLKIALGMKPAPENAAPKASTAPAPDKTSDLVEQYIRSLPQPGGSSGGLPTLGGSSGGPPPVSGASDSPPASAGASGSVPPPGLAASNDAMHPPQVLGPIYASLGEVYAHEGKMAEAQAAFDEAVKVLPAEAADYRENETIVFFQVEQGDAQYAAAKQAIALDPERASLYYFAGQALVGKAVVDPKTQKLTLPPECAEAFQKYLKIAPNGRFAADVRGILTAAGITPGK